jgi:anti-sigma regulatory factor (Ser/Thr protein kinase)
VASVTDTQSFEAQFPAELESVVASRRLVAATVRSWNLENQVASDVQLAVSELVTNSILHAGSPVGLAIRRLGRGVRIEVRDGSDHRPVVDAPNPDDLLANRSMTGRGLALVASAADRWGADPVPGGGKVVWAELGTGQRIVASAPPPAYPPVPPGPQLAPFERAAGLTTASAVTGGGRKVHLIGVPVRLLIESNRHLADLHRELQVMAMDHSGPDEFEELVTHNHELAALVDRWAENDRGLGQAALARGAKRMDFDVEVPADIESGMDRFVSWIRTVSSAMMRPHLLTLPPSPEVAAYRYWYRDEILSQLSGQPPRPCPLEP